MRGQFIQQLRKKQQLTQEAVAAKLGVSRPTYIQIEQGERELTLSEAEHLAGIFGLSFDDFRKGRITKTKVILEKEKRVKKKKGQLQIRVRRKNLTKFKQVLLYVLEEVMGKAHVGETVLHKLLYFIDFDYYEKFEENLMGLHYIKNHHGPTSAELGHVLEEMQKNKEVKVESIRYFNYTQKKYLPLKQPDLSLLSARDIKHIDEVLARLGNKNAKDIERYSHGDVPWIVAKDGQPISYESVFYRDEHYSVRTYDDEL